MGESVYWVWFQLLFGIGTARAARLREQGHHPRELYEARGMTAALLTPDEAEQSPQAMQEAVRMLRRVEAKGCTALTPEHPDYPPLLLELPDRPEVLYCRGDTGCLRGRLAVAMVGTREHTAYGKLAARTLSKELAQADAVVVSGLARGIDAESHRGALEGGGYTVGVLGCGLDINYPRQNASLKTEMSRRGAVISEYPLGYEPRMENFPLRNRIVSGMAHGTLVVEADPRSGSLITAGLALRQGRRLFAVPSSIFLPGGLGTHSLIKQGKARLVETAGDVLDAFPAFAARAPVLPPRLEESPMEELLGATDTATAALERAVKRAANAAAPKKVPVKKAAPPAPEPAAVPAEGRPGARRALPEEASQIARQVYAALTADTMTVDELLPATAMPTGEILSALTELELLGYIQGYPGRRFGLIEHRMK